MKYIIVEIWYELHVVKFITVQNSFKFNNKQISNVGARDMTPKTNKFDIYQEKFSLLQTHNL